MPASGCDSGGCNIGGMVAMLLAVVLGSSPDDPVAEFTAIALRDAGIVQGTAYIPAPPRHVAGPFVEDFWWHDTQPMLLAIQVSLPRVPSSGGAPPARKLVAWAGAASRPLLDVAPEMALTDCESFPGAPAMAALIGDGETTRLFRVSPDAATQIASFRRDVPVTMVSGPGDRLSTLTGRTDDSTLTQWNSNGRAVVTTRLGPAASAILRTTDAEVHVVMGTTSPRRTWVVAVDRSGNARDLGPLQRGEVLSSEAQAWPLEDGPAAATMGARTAEARALWLFPGGLRANAPAGDDSRPALIALDASRGRTHRTNKWVAYLREGSLYMREILEMPEAQFAAMRDEVERRDALQRGKQAALALLMYANENDDVMPGPNDDVVKLMDPYIKNAAAVAGFVYTFRGGTITGVEKPAETEIGYVQGPGGRAIVYLDGHVVWRRD